MIKRFFLLGFLTSNQFIHIHRIAIRGNNKTKIILSSILSLSLNFRDKGSLLSIESVNNLIFAWPCNDKSKLIFIEKLYLSYFLMYTYHIITIRICNILHLNISSFRCFRTFSDDAILHFTIECHNKTINSIN